MGLGFSMISNRNVITAAACLGVLATGIVLAVGNLLQNAFSANAVSMTMGSMNNSTMGSNQTMTSQAMAANQTSTVIRDSETILLEGKSILAKDYIHLYDTTPYMIMNGHIAAKLPCDTDSNPKVQVLTGSAPDLKPADFELIKELSHPGDLCLYHVDLMSNASATNGGNATTITDIAISNPSNDKIEFPATSTVVIGVNEIMPGAEEAHG
jgi:hypothetical protein